MIDLSLLNSSDYATGAAAMAVVIYTLNRLPGYYREVAREGRATLNELNRRLIRENQLEKITNGKN